VSSKNLHGFVGVTLGNAHHHSNAAIEGTSQLGVVERGLPLEPVKHLGHLPGTAFEPSARPGGQNPWDVLAQAATGDVRDRLDRQRVNQRAHALDVNAGRLEQRVHECVSVERRIRRVAGLGEYSADECEAVGVWSAGCESDKHVARHDVSAIDDRIVLDHADAESGQIVVGVGVHPRHFRGLAADEGHAGELAAARDALENLQCHTLVELSGGVVVEKVQRLGALHDDVVGAHGDQIDADATVSIAIDGESQLGADAVGARDEHRSAIAIHRQLEEPPESAQLRDDARSSGAPGERLDVLDETIAGVDVDAGIAIGQGFSPSAGHAGNGTGAPVGAQTLTWWWGFNSVDTMRLAHVVRLVALCTALVQVHAPALATEVRNLYAAEIQVADKDDEARVAAFGTALLEVVVKVSGSRGAAGNPVIVEATEAPERYVQQFRYETVQAPADSAGSDSAEPPLELRVQFDARAVDSLIREAGLPVWGRVRPSVLMLVAVESSGSRELLSSDDPRGWAGFIQGVAAKRAIPVVLPLMDLEDRQRLRASDVWAGFEDNVRPAAARYQSEAVLLGRVYELTPNYWEARWRLLLDDSRSEWLDQGEGLDAVLLAGVHESADRLASRFGGVTGGTVASGVHLNVSGIHTLRDYARTLDYLDSLDEVSRVDVTRVAGESVSFRIDARGGPQAVRQVIALGRMLAEEPNAVPTSGLNYRLLP